MKIIQEHFEKYYEIRSTYTGKETDWASKEKQLDSLLYNIKKIRFQHTKNAIFYEWTKNQLMEEVRTELRRIEELAREQAKA